MNDELDLRNYRWRVGRKVGRTLYAQLGPEPSDDDPLIGVMDHPELAEWVVAAVDAWRDYHELMRSRGERVVVRRTATRQEQEEQI